MVQILHPTSKQKPSFAQSIVGGLAEGTADELKHYAENKGLERQLGINLSGIKDPNARAQIIGDQLKRSRELQKSKVESNVDYSPYSETQPPNKSPKSSELGFDQKDGKTVENVKTSKGQRNVPVTKPLMNLEQMQQKAHENGEIKRSQGIPTTDQDELDKLISIRNVAEAENQQIKNKQIEYGNKYVEKLGNVMPDAKDEVISVFKKKGENGYLEGKTEGEIDSDAAAQATKFKNDIHNTTIKVKKHLGKGSFDKNINSIKNDVQPMLDDGLYDTVRGILDEAGGYPEQIEKVISNLSEVTKKNLSSFEKQNRRDESWWDRVSSGQSAKPQEGYDSYKTPYAPEQMEVVRNNIKDVLTQDPAANLVLLREAYKNKDVEWDEFKDILNELFIKGEIELSPDQQNQLSSTLDNPPLEGLGKILKNLRIF